MYILINEIQKGAGSWMNYEAAEELESSDLTLDGPVELQLKVTNAETRLLVQGTAKGSVSLECARCNEEFHLPLELDIEESFVREDSPEADVSGIDAYEVLTYKEDRLVLDEMLRQNFLAAVPMQPICRNSQCKGMCDQCGANLNTDDCNCKTEEIDPRWEALIEIKNRSSKPSLN